MHTVTLDGVTTEYLSQADVGRALGVSRHVVGAWRRRHKDFPAPDATVSGSPVWLAKRLPEIREWEANRPGQGAGGGRPRKDKDQ